MPMTGLPTGPTPVATRLVCVPNSGAVTRDALCAAGRVTTVPMVLRDAVAVAATVRFAAPPPQLFGLWQPLQSWPTWWLFGRVVRLVTPKKLLPVSWQASQVLPITANISVCLADVMVVPLNAVKLIAWQSSQGVAPEGMWLATIGFGGSLLL